MGAPSMMKRALLGRPIATAEEMQERLPKKFALPVFASDAISSTAYATEEILLALVLAGVAAVTLSIYIAIAVVVLLVFVALSYQQTVHAYPNGGGSYVVSRENLGLLPGMVAAGSLMVDYVMTVAVSVASGVAAIIAAFPALEQPAGLHLRRPHHPGRPRQPARGAGVGSLLRHPHLPLRPAMRRPRGRGVHPLGHGRPRAAIAD